MKKMIEGAYEKRKRREREGGRKKREKERGRKR